jgi:hypothetical protein
MSYVVGSEVETMAFTDHGVEYRPDGLLHAVDTESMTDSREALLGYAVCGTAVRVWTEHPFDPAAPATHDRCAAVTTGARSNLRPQ